MIIELAAALQYEVFKHTILHREHTSYYSNTNTKHLLTAFSIEFSMYHVCQVKMFPQSYQRRKCATPSLPRVKSRAANVTTSRFPRSVCTGPGSRRANGSIMCAIKCNNGRYVPAMVIKIDIKIVILLPG